jgi:nitrogenase subunit NifH
MDNTTENNNRKKQEKPYIKIYDSFMEDKDYAEDDKDIDVHRDQFVLLIIKGFAQQRFNDVSVLGVDAILRAIGFVVNSRNKKHIKESIESLINRGVIKMYEDLTCENEVREVEHWNTYFFKVTDDCYKEMGNGYFTKIYYKDFYNILTMDDKRKAKMFAVYHSIISEIYDSESSDKYTLITTDKIVEKSRLNRKTVSGYFSELEKHKLVFYRQKKWKKDKIKNVYSRWEHQNIVRAFVDSTDEK